MGDREPQPRFWHSAVSCGGKIYVRGGSTPKFDTDEGRRELVTTIEEYDPVRRIWRQLTTTGELHPGLSAVACVTAGDHLYAYGGFDGRDVCSVLSQLNLKTLVWTRLSSQTAGGPMNKDASGMAHFDGDRLALVGGYADPNGPIQPGSTFVLNETVNYGSGWTNEFHVFDIKAGSWSSPEIKGTRPPPCADFTLTSIDIHRAVLYGGCRPPEGKRLDKDLYLIHFSTMEVTRIVRKMGEVWPVVTVGHHAACCLGFNTDHPQLLVSGGRTCRDKCLRDTWKYDLRNKQWEKIELPVNANIPRWGHSATTITLPDGTEEVIIFGGSSADYPYSWDVLASRSLLRLLDVTTIFFGSVVQAAKTSGQLSILRRNVDLAQFVVEGTFTGRQLGCGYFGSVEEITVKGLHCAGKIIKHSMFASEQDSGGWDITEMYLKECRVMATYQHPNIAQFIGVCLHPSSHLPILVMEQLKGHMLHLLENCPSIPLVLKLSMLKDIASGLSYLHPQVIHRDMTAKNVLLTPFFVAKISDFGSCLTNDLNAKIQLGLTPYPGARCYMPPEALSEPPLYDSSLDIFSFGQLALFTMIQEFPDELKPNYPMATEPGHPHYLTEVERREKYFDQLDHQSQQSHELIQLTKDCLHNSVSRRPTARQIVCALQGMNGVRNGICELLDAVKQVATTYQSNLI